MANPSIKNGYFPIANELAENFAKVNITGQEWRIIWVLLRKTWGFSNGDRRKDWDWISITQFEKLTKMKRGNAYNSLKSLLVKRLILKQENLYKFNQNYNEWLLVKRLTPLVKSITPVSQKHNTSVSQLTTHKRKLTKENITKERLSSDADEEFNFLNKLEIIKQDKQKHINIIGWYWTYKGIKFENKEQYSAGLKRELRGAKNLCGYELKRIKEVMFWLNGQDWIDWTIETIHKYIDKDLNTLTKKYGTNLKGN